jgi:hypothetical protein
MRAVAVPEELFTRARSRLRAERHTLAAFPAPAAPAAGAAGYADGDGCCDGPRPAALFSLAMLLNTYGQQLTLGELEVLLGASGFVDVRATQTYGYYSLVSARKP